MTFLSILLLASGLSFDTFAVSLSCGISLPQIKRVKFLKIVSGFAIFQSGFILLGWLLGYKILEYVSALDHWIAFSLLAYIGIKMIFDGFKSTETDKPCIDITNNRSLAVVSFATSIDAFAVGISLALISITPDRLFLIWLTVAMVTAAASAVGLKWGRFLGSTAGTRAMILGGIILLSLGLKILIEHLDILS
ncbi:MAG TPA: hypothetical protein DEO54_06910 [Rikenellaceae bacterium]|nr:MAG: hypothetical protein A2X20_08145 [Bacteroidetes bacterium GWE2_40_15]HBZ25953.1 hypothetical protein [Rikenellaceae bacterium]